MTTGKKLAIVALLGANLALLLGLVHTSMVATAQAAPYPKTNYLMVTGRVGESWDAVYIVDLASERLAAWKFDRTQKRLVAIRGRELPKDFTARER